MGDIRERKKNVWWRKKFVDYSGKHSDVERGIGGGIAGVQHKRAKEAEVGLGARKRQN